MQTPSSSEYDPCQELERLQAALARRLVYQHQEIDCAEIKPYGLDGKELDRAAETLIRKRISQTRSLLPESVRLMGDDYRPSFREYARHHHFDGHRAILLDAFHFAGWVLGRLDTKADSLKESEPLRDALRWEQEMCRARLSRFRLRFMRLGPKTRLVFRFGRLLRIWSF